MVLYKNSLGIMNHFTQRLSNWNWPYFEKKICGLQKYFRNLLENDIYLPHYLYLKAGGTLTNIRKENRSRNRQYFTIIAPQKFWTFRRTCILQDLNHAIWNI